MKTQSRISIYSLIAIAITCVVVYLLATNVEDDGAPIVSSDTIEIALDKKKLATDKIESINNLDLKKNIEEPAAEIDTTHDEIFLPATVSAFANNLDEKYSQFLTAAESGDRVAMYELAAIHRFCGDGIIEGLNGEESYEKSIEDIDFMLAQGRLDNARHARLKFAFDSCRRVYDLVNSDNVDWLKRSYELGEPRAVYLNWKKSEDYSKANQQEIGSYLFKAVGTKDPLFMMEVVNFIARHKPNDVVEQEAWFYLSCRYNQLCNEDALMEYLQSEYLLYEVEDINSRIDKFRRMIESGAITSYNFE